MEKGRRGGPGRMLLLVLVVGVGLSITACEGVVEIKPVSTTVDTVDTQTPAPPTSPASQPTDMQTSTPTVTSTSEPLPTPTSTSSPSPSPSPTVDLRPECPTATPEPQSQLPMPTPEDVRETAIAAAAEVGRTIEDTGGTTFTTDNGTLIIDWIWGTEQVRKKMILAVSWVVRNRVASSKNFGEECVPTYSNPYARCARTSSFQARHAPENAQWLQNHPLPFELDAARTALQGIGGDPTNGATFFRDFTMNKPENTRESISNYELLNEEILERLQYPQERGFHFHE